MNRAAEELSRRQEILLDSVADAFAGGPSRHGEFANPRLPRAGCGAASLTGKPVHDLLPAPRHQSPMRSGLRAEAGTKNHTPASGKTPSFGQTDFVPAEYFLTPILDQGRFRVSAELPDISQRYTLTPEGRVHLHREPRIAYPLTSIRGALGCSRRGFWARSTIRQQLLRIALTNSDRLSA